MDLIRPSTEARATLDVVCALLLDSPAVTGDVRVLAARRGAGMRHAGLWELPGGKIEPGEGPRQALVREMAEELQCTVEVGDHFHTVTHAYEYATVRLSAYFALVVAGEPRAAEHAELRWLAPEKLFTVGWAPADLPIVGRLAETLHNCDSHPPDLGGK